MVILGFICVDFLCIVWLGFLGSLLGFSKDFNGGLQRDFLVLKEIFLWHFQGGPLWDFSTVFTDSERVGYFWVKVVLVFLVL